MSALAGYKFSTHDKLQFKKCLEEAQKDEKDTHRAAELATQVFLQYKCTTDLYFLGSEILGLGRAKNKAGRPLLYPPLHRWVAKELQQAGSKMLIMPRFSLKTTWVKVWMVQRILQDPNTVRIAYVSRTSSLGRSTLKDVVRLLMTPALREIFPNIIPAPGRLKAGLPTTWDRITDDFVTVHRDRSEGNVPQEHQIEVYGVESTIVGRHFTDQIYDDLIDEDTVRSPTMMEKALEFVRYSINLLVPDGNELYVGTPYHYADLIYHCINEKFFKHIIRRAAIENGKAIYPSLFPLDELARRKKRMGNYIFSCQMMCDPLPKEDLMFPPPHPVYRELPGDKLDFYVAVDPAATTKVYSDFTAFAVAAVDSIGRVWVEEAFQVKKAGEDIARLILQLNERYKPKMIGIESGLQQHLVSVIQLIHRNWELSQGRSIFLPIEAMTVSTKDKFDRINMTVGSWIRTDRLKIKENLTDLMGQMEKINRNYTGHDDMVDALSLIFSLVPTFAYKQNQDVQTGWKDWWTFADRMKRPKAAVRFADRFAV